MTVKIDRKSIPRSYRDYLKMMVEMGEFFEIDWNLEMGAICRRALETGAPSSIFNKVKGCPEGFRAAEVGYQKHARFNTPSIYFNKTGEGETGRGHNL